MLPLTKWALEAVLQGRDPFLVEVERQAEIEDEIRSTNNGEAPAVVDKRICLYGKTPRQRAEEAVDKRIRQQFSHDPLARTNLTPER